MRILTEELKLIGRAVEAAHYAEKHVATFWIGANHVSISCNAPACEAYRKAVEGR